MKIIGYIFQKRVYFKKKKRKKKFARIAIKKGIVDNYHSNCNQNSRVIKDRGSQAAKIN
jgi:hypothetical protein